MIPKRLFIFHDGPKPLPEIAANSIEIAGFDLNYDADVYSSLELPQFPQLDYLIETGNWSCLSDIARHYLVHQFGGVYMDTDCQIMNDFTYLLENDWFCTFEPPYYANCAFSGGAKGNKISEALLNEIMAFDFKGYKGRIPLSAWVGPHLQTRVLQKLGIRITPGNYLTIHGAVTILPLHLGFGLTYQQYHAGIRAWPETALIRHHWAKSWG